MKCSSAVPYPLKMQVVVVVVPVLSTGTEESPRVSLTAAELISTGSEHFLLRSEEQIIIKCPLCIGVSNGTILTLTTKTIEEEGNREIW